jgi:hypothetical protein
VALFALPAYYAPWFPPDSAKILDLLLDFLVAFSLGISGVAGGPLVELSRLSRTLCTPDVLALLAGDGCGWGEQGLAFVAGAPHSLCCRLVCQLVARPGGEGQDLLSLGLLSSFCLFPLVAWRLLLGVPGTLLAALVLALHAYFVVAIEGSAAVTAAVDTHANGLFNTRH